MESAVSKILNTDIDQVMDPDAESTAGVELTAETTRIVIMIVVAMFTCLTLIAIRIVLYSCLTRNTNCIRWLEGSRHRNARTALLEEALEAREHELARGRTAQSESDNKLEWHLSDIPCCFIVYPTQLSMALYLIHGTYLPYSQSPFKSYIGDYYLQYFLAGIVGNLVHRLVICLAFSHDRTFKLIFVKVLAIATYIIIMVTMEDAILALVGTIAQLPVLFYAIKEVIVLKSSYSLYSARLGSTSSKTTIYAYTTYTVVVLGAGLAVPGLYFAHALIVQSVMKMSPLSIATFFFGLTFFGLYNILIFVSSIMTIRFEYAKQNAEYTNVYPGVTEESPLVKHPLT